MSPRSWFCETPARALGVLVCLLIATVGYAGTLQRVKPDGRTELVLARPGSAPVRISLTMARVENTFPFSDALLWGGDVGEPPAEVVTSIHVSDGAQTVVVPLGAYCDLGDVKSASLDPDPKGFTLALHGGNTATEYDAKLYFSGGFLATRSVELREFPQQRRDEAKYTFPRRTPE